MAAQGDAATCLRCWRASVAFYGEWFVCAITATATAAEAVLVVGGGVVVAMVYVFLLLAAAAAAAATAAAATVLCTLPQVMPLQIRHVTAPTLFPNVWVISRCKSGARVSVR